MSKKVSKPTSWDDYPGRSVTVISKVAFFSFVIAAYERLLGSMATDAPINLLELGCGSGYISNWLCKRLKVKCATLVDFNPRMLDVARRSCAKLTCEVEFLQEDLRSLELNTQYRLVHSQGVIEHFDDSQRAKLLRTHYQATCPGGYCIVFAPTPTLAYLTWRRCGETFGHWPYTDEVPMKPGQLRHELEEVGFETVRMTQFWRLFCTETGLLMRRPLQW
jgi:cyclopropane fatty-acyl-phospholipid synthase-like methyltransferase